MKRQGVPRELTDAHLSSKCCLSASFGLLHHQEVSCLAGTWALGSSPDSSQAWQWMELLLVRWVTWDSRALSTGNVGKLEVWG